MTTPIFTVGKAPIVHGVFTSEEEAWQAWDYWRGLREIPQRASVWEWPNGLQHDDGRYALDEAVKLPRPAIIAPYMMADMPMPQILVTKADVARLVPGPMEPVNANVIAGVFGDVVKHIADLEGQCVDKDLRIAELEAELAAAKASPGGGSIGDLERRLAALERSQRVSYVGGSTDAAVIPGLLDQVNGYANGGKAHG